MTGDADRLASRLTPKEQECLRLVLENWSSKEIARQLGISHTSVDTHIRRARAKLGLRDRYAAALLAQRWEREDAIVVDTVVEPPPRVEGQRSDVISALRSVIPPLEVLGPLQRLGMVFATAVFIVLVFAIVLNVLREL